MFNGILKGYRKSGFSITEVMVGGAILAGVALGGARMFKDQKTGQKKVELDATLNAFHASVVKVMNDAKNCNATLNTSYNASSAGWIQPDGIYLCSGCTSTSIDYTANPTISARTSPAWVKKNTLAYPNVSTDAWIENTSGQTDKGTRTWFVEDITLIPPATAGTGSAKLRMTYRLGPTMPGAGKTVTKDLNINMRFTQDTVAANRLFKSCLSGSESSLNNLQHDICASMTQLSSAGSIMRWNDVTQQCDALTSVKTCPAGTIIEGVRADGTVHCKAMSQGVDFQNDLMLSSPCAAGTSVRLELVDGKLTTRCI